MSCVTRAQREYFISRIMRNWETLRVKSDRQTDDI